MIYISRAGLLVNTGILQSN